MRRKVRFFVSYAHEDTRMAGGLLGRLNQQMKPSRGFQFELWNDQALLPGEEWDKEINDALAKCDVGLLMISPSFLGSDYIRTKELRGIIADHGKPVIPVLLRNVNMKRQNMLGLDKFQIFRLHKPNWSEGRAYADCSHQHRETFAANLYEDTESRMEKLPGNPRR